MKTEIKGSANIEIINDDDISVETVKVNWDIETPKGLSTAEINIIVEDVTLIGVNEKTGVHFAFTVGKEHCNVTVVDTWANSNGSGRSGSFYPHMITFDSLLKKAFISF